MIVLEFTTSEGLLELLESLDGRGLVITDGDLLLETVKELFENIS